MEAADAERARQALAHGWFGRQPPDLQDRILREAVVRRYPRGRVLYRAGDPPLGLFGLLAGTLQVHIPAPSGGEALVHLGQAGFWIGELALLESAPYAVTVRAYSTADTLFLPRAAFERILADDAGAARRFCGILAEHVQVLIRMTAELLLLPKSARVAARLILLHQERAAGTDDPVELRISQADLAEMIGVSRQRLNVALRALEEGGAVDLGRRRILIRNLGRLAAEVEAAEVGDHERGW
jgi:CRP-like cAMP-binding protein